jgi:uncharacterized Tic20 family protein
MSHVDRRVAAVAHLSIGFGVVVGVGFLLGLAINLVIWLRSRRSPFVELHAEQAGAFQLAVFLTNVTIIGIWIAVVVMVLGDPQVWQGKLTPALVFAAIWCVLLPFQILWYAGTILLGLYGGLMVALGRDFSYPVFGPWARRRMEARGK